MIRGATLLLALACAASPAWAGDVDARAQYQRARDAFAQARFAQALALFAAAEERAETPALAAEIAVHRGFCEALRKPSDALASFVRALRRDPAVSIAGANDKSRALFECARGLIATGLSDRDIVARHREASARGDVCPKVEAPPPTTVAAPAAPVARAPSPAPGEARTTPAAPPPTSIAPPAEPLDAPVLATPTAPGPALTDAAPEDAALGWTFWASAGGAVAAGAVGAGLGLSTLGSTDLDAARDQALVANVAFAVAGVSAGLAVLSVVLR